MNHRMLIALATGVLLLGGSAAFAEQCEATQLREKAESHRKLVIP